MGGPCGWKLFYRGLRCSRRGDYGGLGAKIRGSFFLSQDSLIKILVGQKGLLDGNMTTGGGGAFVVKAPYDSQDSILIIAGGGGGAKDFENNQSVTSGSEFEYGKNGVGTNTSYNGGTNGRGGLGGGKGGGGGGGGFFTDGIGDSSRGGKSFILGGQGGPASGASFNLEGGFGGGGGASLNGTASSGGWAGGGGGGGYSGGGSAIAYYGFDDPSKAYGGGGGSFNAGSEQNNIAGINEGHGKVIISLLGNPKLESAGQTDIFMVRFDANGTVVDSIQGSGSGIDSVNGLAMGKSNEFYLTGVYGPEFTLGEKSVSGVSPIINAYLAQVDGNFSTQWIKTIGGGGFNRGESVAVSAKGRAFFVGSYTGTAHFDERA